MLYTVASKLFAVLLGVCVFASSVLAQSLTCTIPLPDSIKFRFEGLSEPIGDVVIQCNASGQVVAGQPYVTGDIKIDINTNLVNRIIGPGGLTDAILVINENNCDGTTCAPTAVSTLGGSQPNVPVPQFGQLTLINELHWSAVKIPIPDAKAPDGSSFPPVTTLRFTNLRSNASLLGISSTLMPAEIALASATVADVTPVPGTKKVLSMGTVAQGLFVSGTFADLPQCQSQNIVNGAVSGPPTFIVTVREGFEYAFKPLGMPATDGGIRPGEAGYPAPGFGANQGTRFRIVFNNLSNGVRLAVPATVTNGTLSLQLVTTDQSGNGPYQPAAASGLVELQLSGPSAVAFYEVTASNNAIIESADIPVVAGYTANPAANLPGPGVTQVNVSFAPVSFVSTPSSSAPLPRFFDASTPRNAFAIDVCQPAAKIQAITPASLPGGTGVDAVLRLDGSGFTQASVVEWNGSAIPTILGMDANPFLSALVSANLTAHPGNAQVDVLNPGARSNQVMFTITAVPPPAINTGGAVNAASSNALVARGSLASLYGIALSSSTASAAGFPLPPQLGGAKVTVNGMPAPLVYASPTQINFQVPFETPLTGTANVVVTRDGVDSAAVTVGLAEFAFGIFRAGVTPIIVHADYSLVTGDKPATPGEILIAFGTGVGGLNTLPATGAATQVSPVTTARLTPSLTVGAQPADVLFAGLASGFAGLAQFNFRVPTTLPAGSVQTLMLGYGPGSDSTFLSVISGNAPAHSIRVTKSTVTRTAVPGDFCAAPQPETNFLTTDPQVWFNFTYDNTVPGDVGRVEWIDPAGGVRVSYDIPQPAVPSGCYAYAMAIVGNPAASSPGAWHVRLLWNGAEVVSLPFNLALPPADPVTIFSSTLLPDGGMGQNYSFSLGAANGNPPYTWTNPAGNLPPGLTLSSGGLLSGKPTAEGSFNFPLQVTDSAGASSTRNFGLGVRPPT